MINSNLRIGIDFDNTLVSYDRAFYRAAVKNNLISESLPKTKKEIRDFLRSNQKEEQWTALQGEVYGPGIVEAELFKGVDAFLLECVQNDIPVFIISHKTKTPFAGPPYDLHESARSFLELHGFFKKLHLPHEHVFFEPTIEKKISRITKEGCTHFIDDLPEILMHDEFPVGTKKILFDSNSEKENSTQIEHHVSSWEELKNLLLKP